MKKKLIIAAVVIIAAAGILKLNSLFWITPTRSSSNNLRIVPVDLSRHVTITLKHYVNDVHINDYVLDIKDGIHRQEIQTYDLPQLDEGSVDLTITFDERIDSESNVGDVSSITAHYSQAQDLYRNGLLIYYTDNDSEHSMVDRKELYEQYVYLVSGTDKKCYTKETISDEWLTLTDAPAMKIICAKEPAPYIVGYPYWKDNEWVIDTDSAK
ncbi:MAG: hypothetical protein LUF26_04275 [Firmicutes bacterium]|nr:hypothetical protein [Bacillota bacterium]